MNTAINRSSASPRSAAALWIGILGPPAIWLTQFETKYALAGAGRRSTHTPALIAVAVVAMACVILCGYIAARERQIAADSPLDAAAGILARNRFLATLGLMSSVMFLLVTIAQFIADFYFLPGVT
jgi:Na+/melibiose symporter-like transporter